MKPHKKLKSISKITQSLLSEGESERADFKKTPEGITSDDLVAFANNIDGGTILVGVNEVIGEKGTQLGVICGCDVSDGAILQVINKAIACIPPVGVKVYVENIDNSPILRIQIPESENKPHCTPKGIYCRRDGSRNRPLHPNELLAIFLDNEGKAFAERFEKTADKIASNLDSLESSLSSSIDSMASQLGWADYQLGDTESTLSSINSKMSTLLEDTKDNTKRLRILFRQDEREDPVRAEAKDELRQALIKNLSENPELIPAIKDGKELTVTLNGKAALELNKDDVKAVLKEAVESIEKGAENKKTKGGSKDR